MTEYGSKDKTDILKYDSETLNCHTNEVVAFIYVYDKRYILGNRLLQPRTLAGNRCQVCELNRVKWVISNSVNLL